MLRARGVDVIFGIPGVHNVELYRGIEEAGITHILARNEMGAGFMADGYARATGKPGVIYTITGPGLTNAMTPLGQSDSDSVPVLAIASCLDEVRATRGQLHQMRDQRGAAACVTATADEAVSADSAYRLIERAFDAFAALRPRPRYMQVPIAQLGQVAPPPPPVRARPTWPQPTHDQITQAATALIAAQRPLFVFGGGACGGASAVPNLLRQTGAASLMTYAGRGIVPPDHPLCFGSSLARPETAQIAAQADLVVAVGTELSEVDLWRDNLGHTAPMIRVDIDAEAFDSLRPQDTAILGDAATFLQGVSLAIAARTEDSPPKWQAKDVAAARARFYAETEAERPGILRITQALRAAVPAHTMIYSDMTQFAYVAKEVWDMAHPAHWHHPYGFGTLGYGMPAAIGGAIARRGAPTLAIVGDSGFQYSLQELGTAVEHGLSLPIILWDNGKLKEIEDSMIASQIAPNAVEARNPDFLALARAYGARAQQPETVAELSQTVSEAFNAPVPTVIRVTPAIRD
ncbi:MAG: thiamine pyrophosphate-binding protein [Paracoccaceae bacterium]